jgi:hypothetical protein
MSWEAFRWTAKSPSELYHVLGPHGVDDLVRQMIAAVWRDLPAEGRTFDGAVQAARDVFDRNIAVWRRIKKPGPEEFFADLQPHPADGFLRQAMVLTWMMMPRTGGREVKDALRIIADIFDRNLAAWDEDNTTFTGGKQKKSRKPAKPATKAKTAAKAKGAKAMERPNRTASNRTPGKDNGRASKPAKAQPVGAPKVASSVRGASTAKNDEVEPLRAEMKRKIERAGPKGRSSPGKNG